MVLIKILCSIANECFVDLFDLSQTLVKKQLKYKNIKMSRVTILNGRMIHMLFKVNVKKIIEFDNPFIFAT